MTLSSDVYDLIQAEMAQGHYASESELVRMAVLSLQDRRIAHEAIQESFADIAAGRVRTAEAFEADFRARKNLGPRA